MESDREPPEPEDFDPLDAPLSANEIAQLRPASEWFAAQGLPVPPVRGRGRPKKDQTKISVTMRLDPAVVEQFKHGGPGWQTRMGKVLSQSLRASPEQVLARRLAVKQMLLEKAERRQRIRARIPRRAAARLSA